MTGSHAARRGANRAGDALRARRKTLNLSQMELGQRAGVSQTTISHLEKGLKSPAEFAMREISGLLAALEWTPADLVAATGVELPMIGQQGLSPESDLFLSILLRDIHTLAPVDSLTIPRNFVDLDPAQLYAVKLDAATLAPAEVRFQMPESAKLLIYTGELPAQEGRAMLAHTRDGAAVVFRDWPEDQRLTVQDYAGRQAPRVVERSALTVAGPVVGIMAAYL